MSKPFTAQDVLAISPGITQAELQRVLAILNAPRATMEERWAIDDAAREPKRPLIDSDGLTDPAKAVNDLVEANDPESISAGKESANRAPPRKR
jgi:hypothetical protein